MELKFFSDEHIDLPAVKSLQERGIDIVSVQELGLRGRPDEELIKLASKQRRCIITRDKDFLRLAKSTDHKGIFFLTRQLDTGDIIREVEKLILLYNEKDMENSVIFIPLKH